MVDLGRELIGPSPERLGEVLLRHLVLTARAEYTTSTKYRLWYTGESIRPPLGKFDGTISFEPTNWIEKNFFLPYWVMRVNWFENSKAYELQPSPHELLETRSPQRRPLRTVSFATKQIAARQRVIDAVRRVIPVDEFGRKNQKPVPSKGNTSQNYFLQICTENNLYPNYVTEKLQESWLTGCVPIWSGLDSYEFFNEQALIDVTKLGSLEVSDVIRNLSEEELLYKQAQPLLSKEYQIHDLVAYLGTYL